MYEQVKAALFITLLAGHEAMRVSNTMELAKFINTASNSERKAAQDVGAEVELRISQIIPGAVGRTKASTVHIDPIESSCEGKQAELELAKEVFEANVKVMAASSDIGIVSNTDKALIASIERLQRVKVDCNRMGCRPPETDPGFLSSVVDEMHQTTVISRLRSKFVNASPHDDPEVAARNFDEACEFLSNKRGTTLSLSDGLMILQIALKNTANRGSITEAALRANYSTAFLQLEESRAPKDALHTNTERNRLARPVDPERELSAEEEWFYAFRYILIVVLLTAFVTREWCDFTQTLLAIILAGQIRYGIE